MVNFKELDKIELSMDELFRLLEWRDNNKDLIYNYKQVIPEGIIEVKGGMTIFFKFIDDKLTVYESYTDGQLLCKLRTERLDGSYRLLESWVDEEMLKGFKVFDISFSEMDLITDTCTTVSSCMAYLEHFKSEVIIREQPFSMTNTQRRRAEWHIHNNSNKVIRLQKTIYTIPKEANFVNKIVREFNRAAESWGVRGHPRHMSTGKVVWIKPYTKGKGARQVKTYKIEGNLK